MSYKRFRRLNREKATQQAHDQGRFDNFFKGILASAAVVIAFAQLQVSQQQTEISSYLANLEEARAQPKFAVHPSDTTANIRFARRPLQTLIPEQIKIDLTQGVVDQWSVTGKLYLFLSSVGGSEKCPMAVHGVFRQTYRGVLEFVAEKEVQELIDVLTAHGLHVEGAHSELFVMYADHSGKSHFANLTLDGLIYDHPIFDDEFSVYNGKWSGGQGYYFDDVPPADFCPNLGRYVRVAIASTDGKAGESLRNMSPSERMFMGQP